LVQTLQATALVHEAYLRLLGAEDPGWNGRGHFFAAAAEAMRRILVENARRKGRTKAGGGLRRIELADVEAAAEGPDDRNAKSGAVVWLNRSPRVLERKYHQDRNLRRLAAHGRIVGFGPRSSGTRASCSRGSGSWSPN
jgi:ECF sigma factor